MFKFLFKSKFLGFVEAPVGVFSYIFKTNILAFNVKAMLSLHVKIPRWLKQGLLGYGLKIFLRFIQ